MSAMQSFRLWAPNPGRVDLSIRGETLRMSRRAGGWWAIDCAAQGGDDYGYCLDGSAPLPDPRSPWQPYGVTGLSRLVDHGAFSWSDSDWVGVSLRNAVIYELHIGTFSPSGTFDGAIAKLDHIVRVGANFVELMPVAEFSGDRGWGYDGVEMFAPHHRYGGPDGLKRLVNACHARGLGVIMDVVYNHIGPEGGHLATFAPYIDEDQSTPWGRALRLVGAGSTEVHQFVIDNACMWIRDYHCDALRLDAIHALRWQGALQLTVDISRAVREIGAAQGRSVSVLAEDDVNDTSVVLSVDSGGLGLDAVYANTFQRALQAVVTGERTGHYVGFGSLACLVAALHGPWVFAGPYSRYGPSEGSDLASVAGSRFVVYMQNHDQVGNREGGERITALAGAKRVKIGAALALLSPYIPMLFQGEEWAASTPFIFFTDRQHLEDPRSVWRGRIEEFATFGWADSAVPDPQSPSSFASSRLRWGEVDAGEHGSMLEWYRALIAVRGTLGLADQRFDPSYTLYEEDAGWLRVVRGSLMIAANFGHADALVPLIGAGELLLASVAEIAVASGAVYLPGESVAVVALGDLGVAQRDL